MGVLCKNDNSKIMQSLLMEVMTRNLQLKCLYIVLSFHTDKAQQCFSNDTYNVSYFFIGKFCLTALKFPDLYRNGPDEFLPVSLLLKKWRWQSCVIVGTVVPVRLQRWHAKKKDPVIQPWCWIDCLKCKLTWSRARSFHSLVLCTWSRAKSFHHCELCSIRPKRYSSPQLTGQEEK